MLRSIKTVLEQAKKQGSAFPAELILAAHNHESPSAHPENHAGHKDAHNHKENQSQ